MFTSLHICWALFLLLRKRTFEPFPMSKWPITTAMLGKFKLLLPTACLVLPVHPPNTHLPTLWHNEIERSYLFVCTRPPQSVINFLCPALVPVSSETRKNRSISILSRSSNTRHQKLWQVWQEKERENDNDDERERERDGEGEGRKWKREREKLKCETGRVCKVQMCCVEC